uniref:Uncharacterized protein n=1 Tax=Chenopodium quinoa TaxID=63459 RepID=A0A803MFU6_CHEQI
MVPLSAPSVGIRRSNRVAPEAYFSMPQVLPAALLSARRKSKKKALHLALARYLKVDVGFELGESSFPPVAVP